MDLEAALRTHFGFDAFRPGQRGIVEAVLDGREVLAVMPTGAGKSLCYQLPAAMLPGVTVVVSPLIALMKDQVDALQARGIAACYVNSTLSPEAQRERIDGIVRGDWRLVYVAPERFRHRAFVEALAQARIALLAIDEAHCISQWGHDFRPDYARLGELRERLAPPRVAAFTATATPEVREDITAQLRFAAPALEVHGFDRPNLWFGAERLGGRREKLERLLAHLRDVRAEHGPTASAVVYCATRRAVERVAVALGDEGIPCLAYHAGLDAETRRRVQDAFMGEPGQVVAATNAFGMGVDKADIRLVAHHDLPGSIEAYYQEAGRAGRDGAPGRVVLLWGGGDVALRETLLDASNPGAATVMRVWERLRGRPGSTLAGPTAALAGRVGIGEGAATAALRLLEGAGHVATESLEDDRIRVRVLTPDVPAEGLALDLEALDRHAQLERARLRRMAEYASRDQCRRRTLLEYFGDPDAPPAGELCPGCDACDRARLRASGAWTFDEARARDRCVSALSLVAAHDGRFGRRKLALALAGSRSQALAGTGLERHPAFGAFSAEGTDRATTVLDRLGAHGLVEVTRGEYPVVRLGAAGRQVLAGRAALPDEILQAAAPPRPVRGLAAPGATARAADPEAALDGAESARFEALRALRTELARTHAVAPYVVFHDKHLRALARGVPRTREDFLAVKGMGPGRWALYGEAVLAALSSADP